jgi:hypothetical protein
MKPTLKITTLCAVTCIALSLARPASGASLSANWVNNNNGGVQNASSDSLSSSESAGAPGYVQANWNNLGRWGGTTTLTDSLGNSDGVDITWDANWTDNFGGSTATPDGKVMYGFTEATGQENVDGPPYNGYSGPNQPDARVRGLSAWLTARSATTYSVVLYVDGNRTDGSVSEHWLQGIASDGDFGGGITLDVDLTPRVFVSDTANFSGTFAQVPLTANTAGTAGAGNFIVFTNLSADMFMLRSEDTNSNYAPVSAIQIVPEYTLAHIDVQPTQTPAGALYQGQSFSLTVVAVGPSLTYQWRKNNSSLSGQTNPSFSASNITTGDSGTYDVVITNSFGSITSSPVVIMVNSDSPPSSAVVSPAAPTRGVGALLTFSISANGSTPFTYQWKKGGTSIPNQTNATLVLSNLTLGDAGSYTCGVTNFLGGALSSAGVLTVNAVAGTTAGLNFTDSGETVTDTALGVAVVNWNNLAGANGSQAAGALTVAWTSANTWKQGLTTPAGDAEVFFGYLDDGNGGNTVTISGLQSVYGAYVVQALGATDWGTGLLNVTITNGQTLTYSVALSGSAAFSAVSSVSAPLYDNVIKLTGLQGSSGGLRGGLAGIIITDKPVITTQPQAPVATLYSGYPFNLSAAAIGVPSLTYQWRKGGSNISGATNSTYAEASASLGDSGNYDVVVANQYGSVTSVVASVTVVDALPSNVMASPATLAGCVSGTVIFGVTADGSIPATYQWYKGVAELSGQTAATLTLSNLQLGDVGNYSCAVTNAFGGAVSSGATLTVSVCAPATVGINFSDAGEGPTVAAFGVDTAEWTTILGGTGSGSQSVGSLNVAFTSSGTWHQGPGTPPGNAEVLYGYLDDDSQPNVVTISGLTGVFPEYAVQTLGATDNGQSLQNVTLNGSQTLTYTYQTNGSGGVAGYSSPSATLFGDTLVIQGLPWDGSARGGLAGIIITDKPIISNQPQSTGTVYTGGSLNLIGLSAVGASPLNYQWRKNGVNISGGGSTYTKAGVVAGDAGNYSVVVTNTYGSVTSSIVSITVVTPPSVSLSQSGGNVTLTWPSGSLLEATNMLGPWTTNVATSPFTFTPTGPMKFYRLQLQ